MINRLVKKELATYEGYRRLGFEYDKVTLTYDKDSNIWICLDDLNNCEVMGKLDNKMNVEELINNIDKFLFKHDIQLLDDLELLEAFKIIHGILYCDYPVNDQTKDTLIYCKSLDLVTYDFGREVLCYNGKGVFTCLDGYGKRTNKIKVPNTSYLALVEESVKRINKKNSDSKVIDIERNSKLHEVVYNMFGYYDNKICERKESVYV